MSDPDLPFEHDPLAERLRSTFDAERTAVQSAMSPGPRQASPRSRWPLAVAAAALFLGGLVFFGTQAVNDNDVDVGVAAQPTDESPEPTAVPPEPTQTPSPEPTSVPVIEQVPVDDGCPPDTRAADSDGDGVLDMCLFGAPATEPTPPTDDEFGDPIETIGGFPVIPCRADEFTYLVWGIPDNDPDGGLVAHVGPGIDSPVTRILVPTASAFATGRCVQLPSGSTWIELWSPDGDPDWVSRAYLRATIRACRNGAYAVEETISGPLATMSEPVDGEAVIDANGAAGFLRFGADEYQPVNAADVRRGACFADAPRGRVCLSGTILITDPDGESGEIDHLVNDARDATLDGSSWLPGDRTSDPLLAINLPHPEFGTIPAWADPRIVEINRGSCASVAADDDTFEALPCLGASAPVPTISGTSNESTGNADHIHDLRIATNGLCNRVVVEFGTGAFANEIPADRFPGFAAIERTEGWASVRLPQCAPAPCQYATALGIDARVVSDAGTAFIAVDALARTSIEVRHNGASTQLRVLKNPPRLLIDWIDPGTGPAAFGSTVILEPLSGSVLPAPSTGLNVTGWARPFEASGIWQVLAVDSIDDLATLDPSLIRPITRSHYSTTSWIDGWGSFEIAIPPLVPGTYAILVGEVPPTGEDGFIAAGWFVEFGGPDAAIVEPQLIDHIEIPLSLLALD